MRRIVLTVLVCVFGWFASEQSTAAGRFNLTTASVADIKTAFEADALTSERLTQLYLARIEAYNRKGPQLNAVLRVSPDALEQARALDAERRARGVRGPLHGIPVLIKDNIQVAGLPTTAGFYGLHDAVAVRDAPLVAKLRSAGCVILGTTNMSEFALGAAFSSIAGQMRNPHAPDRSPNGSSGGSGAAVAAVFAPLAVGTDTGGSIRGPAAVNGIAGLKPTFGLVGRSGIVPLALSLDVAGPMARYVADLAHMLNAMVGRDGGDAASVTRPSANYAASLEASTLTGARFGLLRDYMGRDTAQDAVLETTVAMLRNAGAEVIDVRLPTYLVTVTSSGGFYETIRDFEFRNQIAGYLKTVSGSSPPRTHADILSLSEKLTAPSPEGWLPNPGRLEGYRREAKLGSLDDQGYLSARTEGMQIVRDVLTSVLQRERLDAFIGSTSRLPARLITEERQPLAGPTMARLASLSGWPELTVPMGFTSNPPLPVGLSFFSPAFSESKLLGYGHAFQRLVPVLRLPVATPALRDEQFDY